MIKPIKTINLHRNRVWIERHKTHYYTDVTNASVKRLCHAVSNVMNQRIAPRITLFPGGFEIEY